MELNDFILTTGEKLYLDNVELKSVSKYELSHSAGDIAELTVTMSVNVNQCSSE